MADHAHDAVLAPVTDRVHRRLAKKHDELVAKHALEQAMVDLDLAAVADTALAYAEQLVDACRELVAVHELEHAGRWLAARRGSAAVTWPLQLALGRLYERLGDPFHAICAVHSAKILAESAGAPDGVVTCQHLLDTLVPR